MLRLSVTDFRCYPDLKLDVAARPVVLTGPNGAGKTNILEALSFLAPGRGLRRSRLMDVARRESAMPAPWAVAATLQRGDTRIDIGTGQDGSSERRVVRIDGAKARSQAMLGEQISVLWLVPAMDRLFTDSAGGRRRFLDRLVLGLDPGHAARSAAYDRALRNRARLLREGRRDRVWLDGLERTIAALGIEITKARHNAVQRLNEGCAEAVAPFPAAALSLVGWIDDQVRELGAEAAEQSLRDLLAQRRGADDDGVGPHRSDFLVRHREKGLPATLCSTGEQKALLIAILLAQAKIQADQRGIAPILLLDEVTAHLDQTRRIALWDALDGLGLQSWMTGTDRALFAELGERSQFFTIAAGRVTPDAPPSSP